MSKSLTKNTHYAQLISDLKGLLEQGKKRAQVSVNQIVVETYWQMGERICADGAFCKILPDLARKCARRAHRRRFELVTLQDFAGYYG